MLAKEVVNPGGMALLLSLVLIRRSRRGRGRADGRRWVASRIGHYGYYNGSGSKIGTDVRKIQKDEDLVQHPTKLGTFL